MKSHKHHIRPNVMKIYVRVMLFITITSILFIVYGYLFFFAAAGIIGWKFIQLKQETSIQCPEYIHFMKKKV